jgi:hypothetical protein
MEPPRWKIITPSRYEWERHGLDFIRAGWQAKRLMPLLGGLDQLLPWIHKWHPEIDKEYGESAG